MISETVDIKKLAVGVDSISHLREIQQERLLQVGKICAYTTNAPRQAEKIISAGSIYWIIKGYTCCRQKVLGFEPFTDSDGRKRTLIIVDKNLIETEQFKHFPFQGWRYLRDFEKPKDLSKSKYKDSPQELIRKLRDIGAL